jgi:16S rRNA pseudouridine516 synthase
MSKLPERMRLDRLLANMGYGSRRDVQRWVRNKAITLDGGLVSECDQQITITFDLADRLRIAGERLDPPPGMIIMLHKPLGVTCSHKEAGGLVYDLLPDRWRIRKPALSTVGRLDKDTSGLLFLTDDGALLHRLISPRSDTPKRYRALLAQALRGDEADVFGSGTLMIEGETHPLRPAVLAVLGPQEVHLTLTEGRYHQVRRMFSSVGNHVVALHRDRIGTLDLPADLAAGAYRLLTDAERSSLDV